MVGVEGDVVITGCAGVVGEDADVVDAIGSMVGNDADVVDAD